MEKDNIHNTSLDPNFSFLATGILKQAYKDAGLIGKAKRVPDIGEKIVFDRQLYFCCVELAMRYASYDSRSTTLLEQLKK